MMTVIFLQRPGQGFIRLGSITKQHCNHQVVMLLFCIHYGEMLHRKVMREGIPSDKVYKK